MTFIDYLILSAVGGLLHDYLVLADAGQHARRLRHVFVLFRHAQSG